MATTKGKRAARQPKVHADEEAIKAKMKPLQDKEELTDKQKEELKALRAELGTLRFRRIAKQRVSKAVFAIRNISNLGGASYTRTAEQVETISKTLKDELNKALVSIAPKVATAGGEKKAKEIDLAI
jgi:alpha-ketoglutarate-dependent taurine dioxygenase